MNQASRQPVSANEACVGLMQYEEDLKLTVSLLARLRRRTHPSQRVSDPSTEGDGAISGLAALASELMVRLEDFQPKSRELFALKTQITTIKEENEAKMKEPVPSPKAPVSQANAAEKVRKPAPRRSKPVPVDDFAGGSQFDEAHGRSGLADMVKQLMVSVIAVEKDHCDPMWGTASMIIPPKVVQKTSDAVVAVVDKLRGLEGTLAAARSTLDLLRALRRIRHPFLTEILVSPMETLQSLMYRFPNAIAGMEPLDELLTSDVAAMDCFAVAIDLLTTTDYHRRVELVQQAIATLRRDFEPRVVLRKSPHEKFKRLRKHDTKLCVTWAGRLLLLCGHVMAYVIVAQEQTDVDDFLEALQEIGGRHAMFPVLFERCHKIASQSSSSQLATEDTHRRSCRLKMNHEATRIHEMCARFSDD